ncbi:hypothetical protein K504DRAFT_1417 [Pleomassaria siparia CBS 279.74]|uniref:Uncharacterized protein n=1 Tax=Pleomassaria siparia CBS 279.74 TaxID=1314801 RepID=A0A6G1KPE8_9PLEO|nr:hypothetical protein K504DRAFT_1417 [Pleomassaria siparia CBS 279.74]
MYVCTGLALEASMYLFSLQYSTVQYYLLTTATVDRHGWNLGFMIPRFALLFFVSFRFVSFIHAERETQRDSQRLVISHIPSWHSPTSSSYLLIHDMT